MRRWTASFSGFSGYAVSLFVLGCIALAVLLPASHAQITSTMEGRITDQQNAAIAGAEVRVSSSAQAIERTANSDASGFYRIAGLPPGVYSLSIVKSGFSDYKATNVELTVNRTLTLNATLQVASVVTEVNVSGTAPLIEPTASSTGGTITPSQISNMPLNGRNYLDLMQLVPGVAVNRQADAGSDAATPVLGERAGNALFMIDGMPNTDQMNGGAAAQFNEDSIMEFQVITAGYKAEFGHGSGGVINVVSKSGTNQWHGTGSLFHRNYKLDSADISDANAVHQGTPFLLRWDPSVQIGGPIIKDKIFFFGSAERIRESRQLNFQWPLGTPQVAKDFETQFDKHSQTYDSRLRAKVDEQLGHHRFTQQVNYTNEHLTDFLPLSESLELPSARYNTDGRHLMLGFNDTATLGNQSDPFVLNIFGQYRGEPSRIHAAHPEAGSGFTTFNLFPSYDTGGLFGPIQYGAGYVNTPALIDQKYTSFGSNLSKHHGRHEFKFGWDFQRTVVDGTEAVSLTDQLFATQADLAQFGVEDAGTYLIQATGGLTPEANQIKLRNNYNGLFLQDDIKLFKNVTLNAGLRWDYDSEFPNHANISPRIGMAWAVTPKTVIRGNYGIFYDHFRMGLARDVPGFGGAAQSQFTSFGFPQLFYGNPSIFVSYLASFGYNLPCLSTSLTDAQIAASGAQCLNVLSGQPTGLPLYGIDHLNNVVASGHAPIPANTPVNVNNVQQVTGLTPQEFAAAASAAIGQPANYFSWDLFGNLGAANVIAAYPFPMVIAPGFKTPHTSGYQFGIQREITPKLVVSADYYHKDMRNMLGQRASNLAFEARLPGHSMETTDGGPVNQSFGPWFAGQYSALIVGARKTMSNHFTLEANYTYANAKDNIFSFNPADATFGMPSDSFVGVVPVVTETATGKTNADGPFVAANGNPVPQAGKFYNGPNYDYGNSALALRHTFLVHGLVQLPRKFEFSSIFRVQSGFPYSRETINPIDVDGNAAYNSIDHAYGRNTFTASTFTNVDLRIAKEFGISERVRLHAYFEMFNLFNTANPAAVQPLPDQPAPQPAFGQVTQALPGREGQVGLRIEF
jgi:hypothetical protein